VNRSVINTLRCNNVTAAIGGANAPTTEDVRQMVSFNFSAQNRATTINDYESLIRTMPSQFGAPAKVTITEENNKIKIKLLSFDNDGKLTEITSNTLKQNIANYLSNYRMINDYISVESANVIDLAVNVDVVLDASQNQGALVTKIIDIVTKYFSPSNRQMGENVYVSEIRKQIQVLDGVISISDLQFFNKVGGQYSSSQTSQRYVDSETKQIELIADTIFAEPTQTYQIRFPNKDINVRVLNFKGVNFS
jgi:phage-related baseplate assembly protein